MDFVKALLFLFLTVFWRGRTHFVVSGGQALSSIFWRRNALICIFSKDQRIYRCSFDVSEVASRWFFSASSRSAKNDPKISQKYRKTSDDISRTWVGHIKTCIRPTCSKRVVSPLAIFGSVSLDPMAGGDLAVQYLEGTVAMTSAQEPLIAWRTSMFPCVVDCNYRLVPRKWSNISSAYYRT